MTDALAFLGVSALIIITPGQDTVLTVRNVLRGGRVGGVFTTFGVCAGQALWAVATSAGISAILLTSQTAFAALRVLGSGYLVFLGARALQDALRSHRDPVLPGATHPSEPLTRGAALRQGLFSNLANPKMLAFFTSLLPQFATAPIGLLALGLAFCSLTFAWLTAYTFVVAKAGVFLRGLGVQRALEAGAGVMLIVLGVQMALRRAWT